MSRINGDAGSSRYRGPQLLLTSALIVTFILYPLVVWLTAAGTQLFMAAVMITVFRDVIRTRNVTVNVIFGSVADYLVLGVVLAMAYQLANTMGPGSVIASVVAEGTRAGPMSTSSCT